MVIILTMSPNKIFRILYIYVSVQLHMGQLAGLLTCFVFWACWLGSMSCTKTVKLSCMQASIGGVPIAFNWSLACSTSYLAFDSSSSTFGFTRAIESAASFVQYIQIKNVAYLGLVVFPLGFLCNKVIIIVKYYFTQYIQV